MCFKYFLPLEISGIGAHICILGCGRSGTSIFGELFQSLPKYRYYSEPKLSDIHHINFDSPVALKVPRPGPNDQTSPGLPFVLSEFLNMVPNSMKFFWQVRHPLDTICSLMVGIANNWGHHPRPPDYLEWSNRSLVERCAHHWNYLNTVGYHQIRHLVTINRFEDMVHSPLQNALRCMEKAGIEKYAYLTEIETWASRVQDKNNTDFIEAACSKPYSRNNHTRKVDRWKENLTKQQIDQVVPLVKQGAAEFNYDLSLS